MLNKKIEWNEKLSTELRSIDQDHARLIDQFNEFVTAADNNATVDELVALFTTMVEEVQKHFAFEEQIMKNIGYAGYSEHKKHHNSLCEDAVGIMEELKAATNAEEIMPSIAFLRALVIKHMVEQDLKIKHHVMRDL